jgi:hypothetical protein
MSSAKLFHLAGLATLLSGIMAIAGSLSAIATIFISEIPEVVLVLTILIADILIVFGLMGLYGLQAKKTGSLGLAGFALAITGIIFPAPYGWGFLLIGILLLALANGRATSLPSGGWWLWLAGAAIAIAAGVLGLTAVIGLGMAISGGGRLWLGSVLYRQDQPRPNPILSEE